MSTIDLMNQLVDAALPAEGSRMVSSASHSMSADGSGDLTEAALGGDNGAGAADSSLTQMHVTTVPVPPTIKVHGAKVTMRAADGCAIFFTLDGSDPTPVSQEFKSGEQLELGVGQRIVKAIAVRDGVGSVISSAFYSYTPQAIVISPDSGVFKGSVTVKIFSGHSNVRYTLDGSLPTSDSPIYTTPILITRLGQTVVTAGCFSNGVALGDQARKTYTLQPTPTESPVMTPASGTHNCPLRIVIRGDGEIRYTVDGSDPTQFSARYDGPLVIGTPQNCCVKAICVLNGISSLVTSGLFDVVAASTDLDADERARQASQGTVFPLRNIETQFTAEEAARGRAEDVMAWMLAAAEMKERRSAELTRLQRTLFEHKDDYREVSHKLALLKKDLALANNHRTQLEQMKASHVCTVAQELQQEVSHVEAQLVDVALREKSVASHLREALLLHSKFATERSQLVVAAKQLRDTLEERFLAQKRMLASFDPEQREELRDLETVVAEQRYELSLLRAADDALEACKTRLRGGLLGEGGGHAGDQFLRAAAGRPVVELPMVEAVLPVPPGKMRIITTVQGNGLQELRQKFYVDACIISLGNGLGIKVVGHSTGVHGFVEAVERIISQ